MSDIKALKKFETLIKFLAKKYFHGFIIRFKFYKINKCINSVC